MGRQQRKSQEVVQATEARGGKIADKGRTFAITLMFSAIFVLCVAILSAVVWQTWSKVPGTVITSGPTLVICAFAVGLLLLWFDILHRGKSVRSDILFLLFVGLSLRMLSVVAIPNKQVSDFKVYHELAIALNDGDGFAYTGPVGRSEDLPLYLNRKPTDPYRTTAFRPPGTPMLLALAYSVGGQRPIVGKILNALLGTLGGLCLFWMVLPSNRRVAFWSAFMWLVLPSSVMGTNLLGTEVPFASLMLVSAFLLTRAGGLKTKTALVLVLLSGAVAGFCCLIRPATHLVLCGVLGILICIPGVKKIALGILLFLVGASVPLMGWGIRNYYTLGTFHCASTNVGISLANKSVDLSPSKEDLPDRLAIKARMEESQDEFEVNRLGKRLAMKRFLGLKDENLIRTFRDVFVKNHFSTWDQDITILHWCSLSSHRPVRRADIPDPISPSLYTILYRLTQGAYLVVLILAVFGAAQPARLGVTRNAGLLALFAFLLSTSFLFLIFAGDARFHFPLAPILCILAANAIECLWRWRETRRTKNAHLPKLVR